MYLTWNLHFMAIAAARDLARATGQRQRVQVEHGADDCGPYRFRIVPAEVTEPCS